MPGEDVSDCYWRPAADARDAPRHASGSGRVWRRFRGGYPRPPKVFKQLDLGLDFKLRASQERERLPGMRPGSLELLLYLYFTKLSGINLHLSAWGYPILFVEVA